jgi:hypothetical protein
VRAPHSVTWFDYDITGAIAFPGFGGFGNTDFNNRGENHNTSADTFTYLNVGGNVQFGDIGDTILGEVLQYDVREKDPGTGEEHRVSITNTRFHLAIGYGMFGNQFILGLGTRISYVSIGDPVATSKLVSFLGAGPQFGVVAKPNDMPFRLGGTLRTAVTDHPLVIGTTDVDPETGAHVLQSRYVVPKDVVLPWELEVGIAWQLGPRPLNPPWINPKHEDRALVTALEERRAQRKKEHRAELEEMPADTDEEIAERDARAAEFRADELVTRTLENEELKRDKKRLLEERKARYLNWPRERILLLASIVIVGRSDNAVALDGFLDRQLETVGTRVQYAPRFGAESEPIANLVRMRAGIYVEPSRFADGTKREHFTFGGDLRTLTWDVFGLFGETTFRVSGFLDVCPRYQNFGLGVGTWH